MRRQNQILPPLFLSSLSLAFWIPAVQSQISAWHANPNTGNEDEPDQAYTSASPSNLKRNRPHQVPSAKRHRSYRSSAPSIDRNPASKKRNGDTEEEEIRRRNMLRLTADDGIECIFVSDYYSSSSSSRKGKGKGGKGGHYDYDYHGKGGKGNKKGDYHDYSDDYYYYGSKKGKGGKRGRQLHSSSRKNINGDEGVTNDIIKSQRDLRHHYYDYHGHLGDVYYHTGEGGHTGYICRSIDRHGDEFSFYETFSFSYIESFTFSIVESFTFSIVESFTYSVVDSFTFSVVDSFSYILVDDGFFSEAPSQEPSLASGNARSIPFIGEHPDDVDIGNLTIVAGDINMRHIGSGKPKEDDPSLSSAPSQMPSKSPTTKNPTTKPISKPTSKPTIDDSGSKFIGVTFNGGN